MDDGNGCLYGIPNNAHRVLIQVVSLGFLKGFQTLLNNVGTYSNDM